MWRKLFSGPWPEADHLLPPPVQQQANQQIQRYWLTRGWQFVLGEVVLWAIVTYQEIDYAPVYGALAAIIGAGYLTVFLKRYPVIWLMGNLTALLVQGMLMSGLGAVSALSFLMPYNIAGMLLARRDRVFVQVCCVLAFWINLVYEAYPVFNQLNPPNYIVVSYNILLSVFIFQTLRYLNHLALEINTVYVADEVQQRSQRFLARVSHELRTPLNSVLGFAKLLNRTELPEKQSHYLHQIIDESEHLNQLVSDLLDSAHLSTGELKLNPEPCDVNAICESVAEEHRPNLPEAVALKLALTKNLPIIQADQVRLRQALRNLVSNAVKYTDAGEITLHTYVGQGQVCIDVRDTGVGISEAEHQLIFVPFVQLDNRKIGVGLGLDIARQLVRLHGGDIRLQSTPGQGSTFTISLPVG